LGVAVSVAIGDPANSQNKSSSGKGPSARQAKIKELPEFTPQREMAALRFVAEHHPELGQVLERLKTVDVDEYRQAIREISESVEQLGRILQQDEELHALILGAWKIQSQAELLAAQFACAKEKDEKVAQQIKDLLYRRVDLERRMVEHRRDRLLEQVQYAEENLQRMQEHRERMVESRFNALTRNPRKPAAAANAEKKPASKQPIGSDADQR
jgi:hypothetical protein